MFAATDPDIIVGEAGICGFALAGLWLLVRWVRDAPLKPDPWDAEIGPGTLETDAVEICPHCLTPQPPNAWFCAGCGRAVGPYNNLMPYVNIFSQAEVMRNGTDQKFRPSWIVATGYFLCALASYAAFGPFLFLFAPLFLISVFRNLFRRESRASAAPE